MVDILSEWFKLYIQNIILVSLDINIKHTRRNSNLPKYYLETYYSPFARVNMEFI